MVTIFRLAFISTILMFSSCELKPEKIEGRYHSKDLGSNYVLTLSKGHFTQTLINNGDTFINGGEYKLSNVIVLYSWKERNEIMDANIGGCNGCELKYENGKLLFYTDPDGSPKETFVKQ